MTPEELAVLETEGRMAAALRDIAAEYRRARQQHPPMHSGHEGYAVIREELEHELWPLVCADRGDGQEAYGEAMQVAAMGLAYMLEVAVRIPLHDRDGREVRPPKVVLATGGYSCDYCGGNDHTDEDHEE